MKTLVAAGFLFFAGALLAQTTQGISSDGRDFYIGYAQPEKLVEPSTIFNSAYTAAYALISSYTDNVVTVSYFDDGGAESTTLTYRVPAKTAIPVKLQTSLMKMDEPGDMPQYRACHISALHPVNVQYFSTGADAGGSYLALATPV